MSNSKPNAGNALPEGQSDQNVPPTQRKRMTFVSAMLRIRALCKSAEFAQITKLAAEERLLSLNANYDGFIKEHLELVSSAEETATYQEQDTVHQTAETLYNKVRLLLRAKIVELTPALEQPTVNTTPVRVEVNASDLPNNLNLGTFNGNLLQWRGFRDRFKAAVHDCERIKPVTKLQHLMTALTGKAKDVVGSRQSTEADYEGAWKRLNEVYNDEYTIVQANLKVLFNLPTLERATYDGLRKLIDSMHEAVRQLRTLTVPVDHWDQILIFMIVQRLDQITADTWLMQRGAGLPTLPDMLEFLERRTRSLAHIQAETSSHGVKRFRNGDRVKSDSHKENDSKLAGDVALRPRRQANSTRSFGPCRCCKSEHPLYRCEEFLALNLAGRKEFILKNRLCMNCLRDGHEVKQCHLGPCLRCPSKPKHNSVICPTRDAQQKTSLLATSSDRGDNKRQASKSDENRAK